MTVTEPNFTQRAVDRQTADRLTDALYLPMLLLHSLLYRMLLQFAVLTADIMLFVVTFLLIADLTSFSEVSKQ